MIVTLRTQRPWRSGVGLAIASAPMWAVHHAWTWEVSAAGMPGLVAYLAVWSGLFVPVAHAALRVVPRETRWIALAIVWAGLEHLRGTVVGHGYPWFMLGHPMIDFAPLAAWGSILGAMGVGFIIALGNSALACAIIEPGKLRARALALGMVTLGTAIIIGAMGLATPTMTSERTLRIGVLQTNMPQSNKQQASIGERFTDFQHWMGQSHELAQARPLLDLIVWPETMFPGLALDEPSLTTEREANLTYRLDDLPNGRTQMPSTLFADVLLGAQDDWGVPMLVGALGRADFRITPNQVGSYDFGGEVFNSVMALQRGEVTARYDKVALTPFGEVMPYISAWPWLEKRLLDLGANGMSFDLSAGTSAEPLNVVRTDRTVRVATPVCFESTVPWVCRGMVYEQGKRRADLVVNVTNDGWFGTFDGGRQHHLLHARWRAIELGVPVVRAANTGISCAIDPRGHVIEAAAARQEAALNIEIGLPEGSGTIYGRIGNVLGPVSAMLTIVLGLVGAVAHRRGRKRRRNDATDE